MASLIKANLELCYVAANADGAGNPGTNSSPEVSSLADLSGHARNGALSNFAYTTADGWTTAPALQFDASTHKSKVTIADATYLRTCPWSVRLVLNKKGAGTGTAVIFGRAVNSDTYPLFAILRESATPQLCICARDPANGDYWNRWYAIAYSSLSDGDDLQFVASADGYTGTLYRNGSLIGSHSFQYDTQSGTHAVGLARGSGYDTLIGKHAYDSYCWEGAISAVQVWSKALSSGEVTENYNAGANAVPSLYLPRSIGSGIGAGIASGIG